MSGKGTNIRNRLIKIERNLNDVAKHNEAPTCNCRYWTAAPKRIAEFEAEVNESCLVHGFRDLGQIIRGIILGKDGVPEDSLTQAKLTQLIEAYEARRARHKADLRIG
jgi:hypothetical protein